MTERVGIFVQDLEFGGTERMMVQLAKGFCESGMAVDVVMVRREGEFLDSLPSQVRVVALGAGRTSQSIFALARYLRREKPSALLSALTHVNVAAVLAGRLAFGQTRIVVSERSSISQETATITNRLDRVSRRLVPYLYPRADAITTVSRGAAEDLAAYCNLPMERIHVINNPVVSEEMLRRAQEDPGHPWLQPGEPPVVLAVGRLWPEKNFTFLVRAFARIAEEVQGRLMILGEGAQREALEALIDELGLKERVRLPGFGANPYAFMSRAKVMALTSNWEGSPNVLVEAMACGTPVISTDCPNGPREILEGGKLGHLVPLGDLEALAQALKRSLAGDNPVGADSRRARAADFSLEAASKAYLDVMLERKGPGVQAVPLVA